MSDNVPTYISPFKISDDFGELVKIPDRLVIEDSLNNNNIQERPFLYFHSQIHTDTPGSNNVTSYPDEIKRIAGEAVQDASGKTLYYSETNVGLNANKTNDFLYKSFVVQRWFPGESTAVQNGIHFRIYDDKTRAIVVSPGTESAWRNALGASNGVWTSDMIPNLNASKITAGTIARARIEYTNWAYLVGSSSVNTYCRWRMVAGIVYIEVNYTSGAGMSAATKKVFATMPAGYRPTRVVTTSAYVGSTNNNVATLWVESTGAITGLCLSSATAFYGSIQYPI